MKRRGFLQALFGAPAAAAAAVALPKAAQAVEKISLEVQPPHAEESREYVYACTVVTSPIRIMDIREYGRSYTISTEELMGQFKPRAARILSR